MNLGSILGRARSAARRLRGARLARPLVEAVDRVWWARMIRAADIVDADLVAAQGFRSTRSAVRSYVHGGFRRGVVLNPLVMERLVASQLSDVGRVPALYAYLVNDRRTIRTSVSWDAPAYAERHPESLDAPGGPVGHAWRAARGSGMVELGPGSARVPTPWARVIEAARGAISAAPQPAPGTRLLFVCELGPDEVELAEALDAVIELSAPDVDSVLRLTGVSAGDRTAAVMLTLWRPNVRVVDAETSVAQLERTTTAHVLLVREPGADIDVASLRALAVAGANGTVGALWIGPDGTIMSAGRLSHAGRSFDLLAAHPPEDAAALGAEIAVGQVAGPAFARPVGAEAVTGAVTLTRAVVRSTPPRGPGVPPVLGLADIATDDLDRLLFPAALRVHRWNAAGPMLARVNSTVTLPDGIRVPSLRWAVKIAAPPGRPGEYWGDTHFARGIADALRRLGQQVVIDAYAARDRATAPLDDVVLALRGPEPIEALRGSRNLLWIISHPDEIDQRQLDGYDRVFAASETWASAATQRFARPVEALLQCTDAHRFRPQGIARTNELLFVGTARGIARPSVVEPIRAGLPVRVYGPDWTGYIPASSVVARSVPNDRLPALYEAAGVVLNDHWPAMQRAGFVSNRLYDVVAAGGRAVSDEVAGIESIFGGAVRTYRDIPELLRTLEGDLDARFPAPEELMAISDRIRREHSFDARARLLLDAALER